MFWSHKVEFTSEDTRILIDRAHSELEKRLGEHIYLTTDDSQALITETQVRNELAQIISQSCESLDSPMLANRIGVTRSTIDSVLRQVVAAQSAFFDGIHVLPPKRIEAVRATVSGSDKIATLSEVCQREQITIKAAEFIFKSSISGNNSTGAGCTVTLVGDYVVPEALLERHTTAVQQQISKAEQPIRYSDVEKDGRVLPLVKKRLGIPNHETEYVPPSYIAAQLEQAESACTSQGYVKAGIHSKQLLAAGNRKLVGPYIVTQDFLDKAQAQMDTHLSQYNWFDTRDLPLTPHVAQYFFDIEKYNKLRSRRKPAILVKPALERTATAHVVEQWRTTKLEPQISELEFSNVDGSSSASEFVDKLVLPSVREINDIIGDIAPMELGMADHIQPSVRKQLVECGNKLIVPEFENALRKVEAKIRAYLNAATSVEKHTDTFALVWDEFQQYVSDRQFSVPESTQVAKTQFLASDEALQQSIAELQSVSIAKMNKLGRARDAAPLLHLAVTIYHSRKICPSGFLKIRGKAVPKIVKIFDFPASFTELRANLKQPAVELLERVKRDALE